MITQADLQAAIAECQGRRNPDAATCIKLAAYYTIMDFMYPPAPEKLGSGTQYSFASAPDDTVKIDSQSDFAAQIRAKKQSEIWPVLDELMETLRIIQPKLYNAVMQKLR